MRKCQKECIHPGTSIFQESEKTPNLPGKNTYDITREKSIGKEQSGNPVMLPQWGIALPVSRNTSVIIEKSN